MSRWVGLGDGARDEAWVGAGVGAEGRGKKALVRPGISLFSALAQGIVHTSQPWRPFTRSEKNEGQASLNQANDSWSVRIVAAVC